MCDGKVGALYLKIISIILFLFGLSMAVGGVYLAYLGGSWYYLLAGIALVVISIQLFKKNPQSFKLFILLYILTVIWTSWEAGLRFWAWVPRLGVLTVLMLLVALCVPVVNSKARKSLYVGWSLVSILIFAIAMGIAFVPHNVTPVTEAVPQTPLVPADKSLTTAGDMKDGDWGVYGRDSNATRFSPLTQINPSNVDQLKKAWVYRTGALTPEGTVNVRGAETTPLKVGNAVYLCSATNDMMRLDPATGKEVWRYHSGIEWKNVRFAATCRGVDYYVSKTIPENQSCHTRIIESTINDGRWRLIAVDAETGQLCKDFGQNGQADLLEGMGRAVAGMVAEASPPPIINGVIVTNQEVLDGQRRDAPSGVIRGYSAENGQLLWAWDVKRPDRTGLPPKGETYSRGTPNSWAVMTGDDKLGLVYVPTGNAAVDYYSALRSPEENAVSSAVVALDVNTGKPRWVFQTVHKDVWDYDIGSQATLFDMPDGQGNTIPALIIPTKRGQLFVLDRRTGKPLSKVEEKPAPTYNEIKDDVRTATQPWSVDMPRMGFPDLTEKKMWGLTPLDQLYCRIKFRQARYDGEFTNPTLRQPWIEYPGNNGGIDWGSLSYNPQTGILISNWNSVPMYNQLLSRKEGDALGLKAFDDPTWKPGGGGAEGPGAQVGAPYAISVKAFDNGFTGVLCNEPPYGMITAINMHTKKVLWQKPLGTARANGPFGLPTGMPFEFGVPSNGGSISTASGLTFIAAATDNLIRAIDVNTGKTVWSDVLPAGGQATPMTYEYNGKQYLIIMAGGHHFMGTPQGDYVVAYALPDAK
ncbi:membrane-bound PQQ-dependent dehydrogenase, glucose/quinate/shikimate family [Rosenbergiella australiborealis]|uniref:Membrane-bound PQQ-dependent dehydrogenase, glucose/quinate/shikimate family n=2 Tax=Rosenbergiella australiborealis TaxID=1544696 RepID=A0ABS5T6P0_9GAMM|nr:membrane-bound PQQ-dependent dehydrogenase, glucose/quinate/shikimate family [Rosenbergiella australiborealis]